MTETTSKLLYAGTAGLLAAGAWACGADFQTDSSNYSISPDNRYIVEFSDGYELSAESNPGLAATQSHGEIRANLGRQNAVAAEIPEHAMEQVANSPGVKSIEVDQRRFPLAEDVPYGIEMVQADQVADSEAGSHTVCVIDSGYDVEHEDLSDGSNVTKSDDAGSGDAFVDGCGHGTHVAGTIAALTNDIGVLGILPNDVINLHIVKVFGNDCSWSYSSDLIEAANTCADNGADVINMSLGGGRKSKTEERAFDDLYAQGVLPVAAAGNDGSTQKSYPASYDGVVSVAAIDQNKEVADFSQKNNAVELAAPGVGVKSTVPTGSASVANLTVGSEDISAVGMEGSPEGSGTGPLVDCGLGTSTCEGAQDAVCLIERGEVSFSDKVLNCEAGGGVAAVVYNNESGDLHGTLGDEETSIPSAGISQADGQYLVDNRLGDETTLAIEEGHYGFKNGTSMASPHVAGVAALVWSHHPDATIDELRAALQDSAEDLGDAGRDNSYGYGLVRAKAAVDLLGSGGGDGGDDGDGDQCTEDADCDAECADGETGVCTDGQCFCEDDGGDDGGGECLPKHDPCEVDADCCSLKCRGPAHNRTCK